MVYNLRRESDNEGETGKVSVSTIYDEYGNPTFSHNSRPIIGESIGVGSIFDMWQTTEILEILEDEEDRVKFKTINSVYIWSVK